MAHVAYCMAPFIGHVNPTLAVVSELAGRGHRVSYATTADLAPQVRAAGGHVVRYETSLRMRGGARPPRHSISPDYHVMAMRGLLRELQAVAPVLIGEFGDDPPDVMVCDPMSWPGLALASRWQIPPVTSITAMIGRTRWSLGPVGASLNLHDPAVPGVFAATSAVLAGLGARITAERLFGADAGTPVIAYFPRAFQAGGDDFGPHVHFVGPCPLPWPGGQPGGPPGGGPSWRPSGELPVVLVSLGTVFNRQPEVFRRCAEALAAIDCQVVMALGGLDAAELGTLPGNVSAFTYIPLAQVLPAAAAFVSHAGTTSVMEALSYGVPIVAVPQTPEQQVNADRIAELGLGIGLGEAGQSPDGVRAAVTELLGAAGIGERLAWMRAEIGRSGGAPAAADVIEAAIRDREGRKLSA